MTERGVQRSLACSFVEGQQGGDKQQIPGIWTFELDPAAAAAAASRHGIFFFLLFSNQPLFSAPPDRLEFAIRWRPSYLT